MVSVRAVGLAACLLSDAATFIFTAPGGKGLMEGGGGISVHSAVPSRIRRPFSCARTLRGVSVAAGGGGSRATFTCLKCGTDNPKKFLRCLRCGEFETCVEKEVPKVKVTPRKTSRDPAVVSLASAIESLGTRHSRIKLQDGEFDRAFGGGIVPGSVTLLGGDPGVGKSTLALQLLIMIGNNLRDSEASERPSLLYVAGEETVEQVAGRAARILAASSQESEATEMPDNLLLMSETTVEAVVDVIERVRPLVVIVDSIQTMMTLDIAQSPGSVVQVRECAQRITTAAKMNRVATIIIGHVTKSGEIAGPRLLEHVVDTVIYLEGERLNQHRILRAVKNRFGSTSDIGILEMTSSGLRGVKDPSSVLVSGTGAHKGTEGCAMCVVMEGSRPLVIEIQALTTQNPNFSQTAPMKRVAIGLDYQRMSVVLAILGRKSKIRFSRSDCWVSVVGGLRLNDSPACDLAMAAALASSKSGKLVSASTCFAAEIGLGGELRLLPQLERRLREAAQFGFKRCVVAATDKSNAARSRRRFVENMEVVECRTVEQALSVGLEA